MHNSTFRRQPPKSVTYKARGFAKYPWQCQLCFTDHQGWEFILELHEKSLMTRFIRGLK